MESNKGFFRGSFVWVSMLNCKSTLQVGGDVQWSIPVPSSHAPWINRENCGILLFFLRSPNKKPEMVCFCVYRKFGH